MKRKNIIILGAAGRDYHNFNVFFRDKPEYNVVAFTAAQIPGISGRTYPPKLAGKLYPKGIKIYPEEGLPELIKKFKADQVVFAYSDVSHEYVMHKASIALSEGADFVLLGPNSTMLKSKKPVIAITAVRTGAGKSQVSRGIAKALKNRGKKVVVLRHPMPYGNLEKQAIQRFETINDLDKQECTIEEREEYEPLIKNGIVVYAGVDYERILREAEKEADIIIWEGGNNDFSFIKPDLHIVVTDPHRAGHELKYHPGEANVRMADIVVINKTDSAKKPEIQKVVKNVKSVNPKAKIIPAKSPVAVDKPWLIRNKKVLVIEDGPTLTHGGMSFGAGTIVSKRYNCTVVDARKHAVGSIKSVYKNYPHLKKELPAMGYSKKQIKELEKTINSSNCDAIIDGTPVNLSRILSIKKPIANVTYEIREEAVKQLEAEIRKFKII